MKIIFICSLKNKPYGGIDHIIKTSILLKKYKLNTFIYNTKNNSFYKKLFYKTPDRYKYENINFIWSKKNINMNDFVIIPEIYVSKFAQYFIENKFRFSILIQGPFLINSEDIIYYKNACFYISVSNFINDFVKKFIPFKKKILRLILSPNVDNNFKKKQKIISYMPRKLNNHSMLLIDKLKKQLPTSWSIVAIHNQSKKEVINYFNKSSIFLSLTDLEGFGLPALEAGLCKNIVIGYDAQGSKEYFKSPLYYRIDYGNLLKFEKTIYHCINLIDNNFLESDYANNSVESLRNKFSKLSELESIELLADTIKSILYKNW